MRELTYENKTFGLPINIDIWGVYVNMGIMKELGYTEAPRTWSELHDYAVKATIRGSDGSLERSGFSMQWIPYMFTSFMISNGTNVISDDGLTTTVNDDYGKETLAFFESFFDDEVYEIGFESGLAQGEDPFITGKSAMVIWPTSMLRSYQTYGGEIDFTFVGIPGGPQGSRGGIQTGFSLVIPAAAKHADEAFDFMGKSLTDFDDARDWCNIIGGFSPLIALQNDPYFIGNPYYANIISDIGGYRIRPNVPGFIQVEGSVFAPNIQSLFEGSLDIDKCLQNMQADGDAMLADYRK